MIQLTLIWTRAHMNEKGERIWVVDASKGECRIVCDGKTIGQEEWLTRELSRACSAVFRRESRG